MKKLATLVILFVLTVGVLSLSSCQKIDTDKLSLVWEDEFDGEELDYTKWHFDGRYVDGKNGAPRNVGYWVDDAFKVEDGNLVMTTEWREDGDFGAGWYSGVLSTAYYDYGGETNGGFAQKYGYFEIRCKVPAIYGSWSAFWMMPTDNFANANTEYLNTGIDGTEIDIFESPFYYDIFMRQTVSHAVHYDGYGEHLKSAPKTGVNVPNLYGDFHTYGLEWTENYYKFYVDGICTWTVTDEKYKNRQGETVYQNIVSQVEEYIILSSEVVNPEEEGGTKGWCGDLAKNDKSKKYDFVIDYVRVYQLNQ